jgi:hypothetical protein
MNIYLDEDLSSGHLAGLLGKAGHDVATPADAVLLDGQMRFNLPTPFAGIASAFRSIMKILRSYTC